MVLAVARTKLQIFWETQALGFFQQQQKEDLYVLCFVLT